MLVDRLSADTVAATAVGAAPAGAVGSGNAGNDNSTGGCSIARGDTATDPVLWLLVLRLAVRPLRHCCSSAAKSPVQPVCALSPSRLWLMWTMRTGAAAPSLAVMTANPACSR